MKKNKNPYQYVVNIIQFIHYTTCTTNMWVPKVSTRSTSTVKDEITKIRIIMYIFRRKIYFYEFFYEHGFKSGESFVHKAEHCKFSNS